MAKAAAKKKAAPKKAAKKAAPKATAKPQMKAKPQAKAKKAAPAPKHESFMTKLLKQKEEHMKHAEEAGHHDHNHQQEGFHSHARGASFQKFAGHRRRNAS